MTSDPRVVDGVLPAVVDMLDRRRYTEDPAVSALVDAARRRFGNGNGDDADGVEAIVLYGSFTRGQTDTLLDLYVLLEDLSALPAWQRIAGRMLAPNVYQLVAGDVRAKVAVMTFDALEKAVGRDVTPYFWARFAQPSALVYDASDAVRPRLARLVTRAAERLVAAASLHGAGGLPSAAFWEHTFAMTYGAELRSERPSRYRALYEANAGYFDVLHTTFASRKHPPQTSWAVRRLAGKVLSVLRLMKSAFTFDDPVDYALWKVERHSGVAVTATERQRRYPLIFAWPLVWRLYRQGALK